MSRGKNKQDSEYQKWGPAIFGNENFYTNSLSKWTNLGCTIQYTYRGVYMFQSIHWKPDHLSRILVCVNIKKKKETAVY